MRLLLLGGTGFAGFHTASTALEAGDDVYAFNRGRTRPDALQGAKRLTGDRVKGDLTALGKLEGSFDAVIDFTGYLPPEIDAVAEHLAARTARYIFISSISAYAWPFPKGATEDAPLAQMPEGADPSKVTGETYGALKALCEQRALERFGSGATIVRPGLIVGPLDPTDRFTYWVRRGVEGGKILAPGDASTLQQVIDGRDLAAFLLTLARSDLAGTFNAVGDPTPFSEMLTICCPDGELVWMSDERLTEAGVQPGDLPLWHPGEGADTLGTVSNERASAAGLQLRPLSETVSATRAWDIERGQPELKTGMSRQRQDDVIATA